MPRFAIAPLGLTTEGSTKFKPKVWQCYLKKLQCAAITENTTEFKYVSFLGKKPTYDNFVSCPSSNTAGKHRRHLAKRQLVPRRHTLLNLWVHHTTPITINSPRIITPQLNCRSPWDATPWRRPAPDPTKQTLKVSSFVPRFKPAEFPRRSTTCYCKLFVEQTPRRLYPTGPTPLSLMCFFQQRTDFPRYFLTLWNT